MLHLLYIIEIKAFFNCHFLRNKVGDPYFFFIFGVSTLWTNSRGEMKKISPLEDFGANVLKQSYSKNKQRKTAQLVNPGDVSTCWWRSRHFKFSHTLITCCSIGRWQQLRNSIPAVIHLNVIRGTWPWINQSQRSLCWVQVKVYEKTYWWLTMRKFGT